MKPQALLHYKPLKFHCPDAVTNWACGTDDPEKVTCPKCFSNMALSTSNRLNLEIEDVCPGCFGAKVDPADTRRWCPRCQGSGEP